MKFIRVGKFNQSALLKSVFSYRSPVFFLLSFSVLLFSFGPEKDISGKQIISNMNHNINKVETLRFKMKKKERINGKVMYGEQDCKFNKSPKKIYTRMILPKDGIEVLYVEGENGNKALVNPNGFPYISLSLDPYGSSMRNNNHHTVHEVGFDYLNSIVDYIALKSTDNFEKIFKYVGDTVFNNRKCYVMLIDYQSYAYVPYTVKKGETITDIAYRNFVSDYMILEVNGLTAYDGVKVGQVIKVPNAYARKTYLFIDKQTFLPLVQAMYDDKGFYAQYEFHNLQVNVPIRPEEFTRTYKDYNF
ncbi:MAG: DUF1571 domain-containing protein [Cytophagaceae bacterium]